MKKTFTHFAGFLFSDHLVVLCTGTSTLSLTAGDGPAEHAVQGKNPTCPASSSTNLSRSPICSYRYRRCPCPSREEGAVRVAVPGKALRVNAQRTARKRLPDRQPENRRTRHGRRRLPYFRAVSWREYRHAVSIQPAQKGLADGSPRRIRRRGTAVLAQVRRMGDYLPDVRGYIGALLAFKERYYYSEAVRHEKDRRWDEPAPLPCDHPDQSDNFEANYRSACCRNGPEPHDAFKYLQRALALNATTPRCSTRWGFYTSRWTTAGGARVISPVRWISGKTRLDSALPGHCHEKLAGTRRRGRFTRRRCCSIRTTVRSSRASSGERDDRR